MKESAGPPRELTSVALALRPRVESVCLRLLRNRSDAEDAAQTVYRLFLEKAPEADASRTEAWLLRTAVLVSKNERRARARRARPPAHRPPAPPPGPDEPACPPLGEALATLPSPLREALSLRYLRDRSVPETAAALGCPPRTLEKRLRRGLELLRRLLARRGWLSLPAALAAALGGRRLEACARSAAPGVAVAGVLLLAGSLALRREGSAVEPPPSSAAVVHGGVAAPTGPRERPSSAPFSPAEAGASAARPAPAFLPVPFTEFSRLWVRLSNRPRILENWRDLGIDASLDILAAAPGQAKVDHVAKLVFEEWAHRDGASAAGWLETVYRSLPEGWMPDVGPDTQVPHLGAVVVRAWRNAAPETLNAWLSALPDGRSRDWWHAHLVVAEAADSHARFDALADRLDRLPWDDVKLNSMMALARSWGTADPLAAADWVWRRGWTGRASGSAVSAPSERPLIDILPPLASYHRSPGPLAEGMAERYALSAVVHAWVDRDPEAAWQWCRSRPAGSRAETPLLALGYALTSKDPEAALRYVDRVPDPEVQARWREHIAHDLALKSPEAALELADRLPPGDHRDRVLHGVVTMAAVRRPDFAAEWLARRLPDRLPEGGSMRSIADGFVDVWAGKAPKAAAEWIQGRADPEWRDRALRTVGVRWARTDPAGLAAHADANGSSPSWAPLLGSAAVSLWADDRTAALRVVDRMPAGAARCEAVERIAAKWAEVDPDASGAWALRWAHPSERDAALLGLVRELADQGRPDEAEAWVAHLRDEQARAKARDLLR